MGETLGNVQRTPVVCSQLYCDVIEICRTLRSEIHNDVKDPAAYGAHEFCLRRGRKLKMHAPKRSPPRVKRYILLRYYRIKAMFFHFVLTKYTGEEASIVIIGRKIYYKSTRKLCLGKLHTH